MNIMKIKDDVLLSKCLNANYSLLRSYTKSKSYDDVIRVLERLIYLLKNEVNIAQKDRSKQLAKYEEALAQMKARGRV